MANVTGTANTNVNFSQVDGTGYLSALIPPTAVQIPMTLSANLTNTGTAANQCDLIVPVRLSLAAATQTIDLTSLTDIFGNAVNMARVRYLAIRHNGTTDAQPLIVGANGTNPWTAIWSGTITIEASTTGSGSGNQNNGFTQFLAPNTTGYVVSGTSKIIKFDPGANTFTVDIIIVGCSV